MEFQNEAERYEHGCIPRELNIESINLILELVAAQAELADTDEPDEL